MTLTRADTEGATIEGPQPPETRILAATAYLATVLPGLWVWYPLVLYYWKGRRSRFIGFHAIQSLLLDVALIPFWVSLYALTLILANVLHGRMQAIAENAWVATGMAAFFTPPCLFIWMGVRVMRGFPGVLPLLGRLTKQIIGAKDSA